MKSVILRTFFCLLAGTLFSAPAVFAQLSVVGEIRPRAEFRNGFKTLNAENTDPAFFIEQRSRIYAIYGHEKFNLGVTFQDIRMWGNTSQIYKADPALTNLSEAWGEYLFTPNISLKFGRQVLAYDNDRFLGSLDWAQQGRSHDLALLKISDSTWQLHAGAAFNQPYTPLEPGRLESTLYTVPGNYKTMQFAWFNKTFNSGNLSLLVLNNGVQQITTTDTTVNFSQTVGGILTKKLGKAKLEAEFYQQLGKNPSGKDINAQLIAAHLTFPVRKVNLTLGGDYLSGTAVGNNSTDNAFNPLYGTNHKFYGLMDYFYVGNNHGQGGTTSGLIDLFVSPVIKLGSKTALVTAIHQFMSPVDVYSDPELGINGETQRNLGTELDLVLNVNLQPEVNFKLGYSQLFATDAMRAIKNGSNADINNWIWLMMTIKPKLL